MTAVSLAFVACCLLACTVQAYLPARSFARLVGQNAVAQTLPLMPPEPRQTTSTVTGSSRGSRRMQPLRDLLGLGPAEIAITLVVALVLFGPETLKSLSKDVGKAAAELKEIPKTFKEGMDEGAQSTQVAKMKAIAAEKRAKKAAASKAADDDDDDDDDDGAPAAEGAASA